MNFPESSYKRLREFGIPGGGVHSPRPREYRIGNQLRRNVATSGYSRHSVQRFLDDQQKQAEIQRINARFSRGGPEGGRHRELKTNNIK